MSAWIAEQRAAGWPSYHRAAYAHLRLGVPWERSDDPADEQFMRAWWENSRRVSYNGVSPEDVRREIEAAAPAKAEGREA